MITFQEFQYNCNLILERYYAPDEKLPGGDTPVGKATKKGIKGSLLDKVKHGAGNPTFNPHSDSGVVVNQSKDKKVTEVDHPESGIYFTVTQRRNIEGKPHHDIEWNISHDISELSPKERTRLANTAKNIYKKNIEPRFPSHSVVSNTPGTEKHERAYKRYGFGDTDDSNRQYANVGRQLSPREQQNRRRPSRLTPFNPT